MAEYTVTWTIDVEAESPLLAAAAARRAAVEENTMATVFVALNRATGESEVVDLYGRHECEHFFELCLPNCRSQAYCPRAYAAQADASSVDV